MAGCFFSSALKLQSFLPALLVILSECADFREKSPSEPRFSHATAIRADFLAADYGIGRGLQPAIISL